MPMFESEAFVRTELVTQVPQCSRFTVDDYDGRECENAWHARSELVPHGTRGFHLGLEVGGNGLSDARVIHTITPTGDGFPLRDGRLELDGGVAWRAGALQGAVDVFGEGSALGFGTAQRLQQVSIEADHDRSLALGVRSAAAARVPFVGATTFEGRASLALGNEVLWHIAPDLMAEQRDFVKLQARDLDGNADLHVGVGVPVGRTVLAFTMGPKVAFSAYDRAARTELAQADPPTEVPRFHASWDLVGGVALEVPLSRQP